MDIKFSKWRQEILMKTKKKVAIKDLVYDALFLSFMGNYVNGASDDSWVHSKVLKAMC